MPMPKYQKKKSKSVHIVRYREKREREERIALLREWVRVRE
jgi:hypothetical protein